MIDLDGFREVADELRAEMKQLPKEHEQRVKGVLDRYLAYIHDRFRFHSSKEDGPIQYPGLYCVVMLDAICPVMLLTVTESMLENGKVLDLPSNYRYVHLNVEIDVEKILMYTRANMKDKRHV